MSFNGKVGFGIATGVLAYQLLLPPVVGVSNNGDFGKTFGLFNLGALFGDEFRFADTRYEFSPGRHSWAGVYSSELVLVALAVAINSVVSKDGSFDLRVIGTIHAALFLAAFYLFARLLEDEPPLVRIGACAAGLFMFCDVMYVSYLNSFYMDVASYIFLLLSSVLYLRIVRWRRRSDIILFVVCCLMLATSKAQHALLGVCFAILILVTGFWIWPNRRRLAAVLAISLGLLASFSLSKSTPPDYPLYGCFTVIFYQVLPHSKNVDRTLADLGLDDSYRPYIGMHSFSDGAPMEKPDFLRHFGAQMSYPKLAFFFLTHPQDAYRALRISLNDAGLQRPASGNFDVRSGIPPMTESHAFALWSGLRRGLFYHNGPRFFFAYLLLAAAVAVLLVVARARLPWESLPTGAVLILMGLSELFVSSLADAVDVIRHHFLFFALFDMLVLTLVYLVLRLGCGHKQTRNP